MNLTKLPCGVFVRVLQMESKAATILCIDDEQTALQLRQNLLESAGYRVFGAKSGALGLKAFKSELIDAVILDYWMADMNCEKLIPPFLSSSYPRMENCWTKVWGLPIYGSAKVKRTRNTS